MLFLLLCTAGIALAGGDGLDTTDLDHAAPVSGDDDRFCNVSSEVTFRTPCVSCSLSISTFCPDGAELVTPAEGVSCYYTMKLDRTIVRLQGRWQLAECLFSPFLRCSKSYRVKP